VQPIAVDLSPSSGSDNSGVYVGIAVGLGCAALIVLVVIIVIVKRKQRQEKQGQREAAVSTMYIPPLISHHSTEYVTANGHDHSSSAHHTDERVHKNDTYEGILSDPSMLKALSYEDRVSTLDKPGPLSSGTNFQSYVISSGSRAKAEAFLLQQGNGAFVVQDGHAPLLLVKKGNAIQEYSLVYHAGGSVTLVLGHHKPSILYPSLEELLLAHTEAQPGADFVLLDENPIWIPHQEQQDGDGFKFVHRLSSTRKSINVAPTQ
jgi:hypothetical protein